ncbi:MAG TPA: DMT family transporter [Acidimicrobiia bacterium]
MNPWTPLVVATLGWGSAAVLTRALLNSGISTFTVVPMRFGIALIILLIVSRFWKRFRGLDQRHWVRGFILGGVALALPNTLFTMGLEDLPVSLGGLLVALIPLATVGAAHFLVEGERFNPRSIPGLVVSLVGTGILVGLGGGTLEGVGNLGRGVTLSLIAVCLAGVGGALTRRFALEVGGDGLVIPQFATAIALGVVATPFLDVTPLGSIPSSGWALLIALGALATAVPFSAFLMAAEVNPAARLGVAGYVVPIIAVLLAVTFLDERLTLAVVVGAALIIGGVILTERSSHHVPVAGVNTAR